MSRSTSASNSFALPAIPPPLPHSTSLPSLANIDSPSRPRTSVPQSPIISPAAKHHQVNFHPYLVQTSASSLLTRNNASPSQPVYDGSSRHRVSRSMSALNKLDLGKASGSASESEESRSVLTPSHATPERKPFRRSGTLPSVPMAGKEKEKEVVNEPDLPQNPKYWTPTELALYLGSILRTGGVDGTGQILPKPLVEDIKSWVLRHQISGKAFIKGPEGWTSGRAPPFLPLLTSVSRRLRRTSLQGRLSNSTSTNILPVDDTHSGTGSVLLEMDEMDAVEGDDIGLTGVQRMAKVYDDRSSASEASGDESHTPLRAQGTGDSTHTGHASAAWRRWEGEMRQAPLRSQHTGSSAGGDHPEVVAQNRRTRRESDQSAGGLADVEGSPRYKTLVLKPNAEVETEDEVDLQQGGTIKASSLATSAAGSSSTGSDAHSPPPPYASPDIDINPPSTMSTLPATLAVTPQKGPYTVRDSMSTTPTPDPARIVSAKLTSDTFGLDVPHISPADPHPDLPSTKSRYASLGRRQRPAAADSDAASDDDEDDANAQHYSTARRVTIRAHPVSSPRNVNTLFDQSMSRSKREEELESQLTSMMTRIEELEGRLATAEKLAVSRSDPPSETDAAIRDKLDSPDILHRLGFGSRRDDPLPSRVRELPAYLFLVGFGVGAVVVRVLFSRR